MEQMPTLETLKDEVSIDGIEVKLDRGTRTPVLHLPGTPNHPSFFVSKQCEPVQGSGAPGSPKSNDVCTFETTQINDTILSVASKNVVDMKTSLQLGVMEVLAKDAGTSKLLTDPNVPIYDATDEIATLIMQAVVDMTNTCKSST